MAALAVSGCVRERTLFEAEGGAGGVPANASGGEGGKLPAGTCPDCACTGDADCGPGRVCEGYECQECSNETCPVSWSRVTRNGCGVCVPPSNCKPANANGDCDDGRLCLAGLTCLPGCDGDPACCFGNQCSLAGCSTLEGADCLIVGCPAGSTCKVVGEAVDCKCDDGLGKWTCSAPPQNVCVPR